MRVLYVNHTGLVGGGERSLLALLNSVPGEIDRRLACPTGDLLERATSCGVEIAPIAEFAGSLKLHPVHTPAALGSMAIAAAGVMRAARAWRPDVLHANTLRAGMIAAPGARALECPLVLHVRDCLPSTATTRRLQALLGARSAAVIAISEHVAQSFDPNGLVRRLRVVDNPFDLERLEPARIDRMASRSSLGLPRDALVLVQVGQITPWKGQEEAIRALGQVRRRHRSAVLLIVGETKFVARATRHDNAAYLRRLERVVAQCGLAGAVRFLGEREDVPEILRASDVALAPSWEEPFGRVVVEAMAMGVPVVATAAGGPAEVIRNGIDGVLVAPRRPEALADAVLMLLDDGARREAMGAAARDAIHERFGQARHACAVTDLYTEVAATRPW